MNYLHINHFVPPVGGGTEIYLEWLCHYFNDLEHKNSMHTCSLYPFQSTLLKNCFHFTSYPQLFEYIKTHDIHMIILQNTGLFDATPLLKLDIPIVKIINDYYLFSTWSGGYNRLTLYPSKLPYNYSINPFSYITRNSITRKFTFNNLCKKTKIRNHLNLFYRTLVFTEEMKSIAEEAGITNCQLFPHGPPKVKHLVKIPQKEKRIQFSAGLYRGKGIHLLFEVANYLKESGIMITITGNGPMKDSLINYCTKHNLTHVDYLGKVSRQRLNQLLETTQVFCITSIREALGLNGMEAMSFGTPVIAFDTGGISHWLKHNTNGILIKPFDTQKMADEIIQLCNNSARYTTLSQQALESFNNTHDWAKVAQQQQDIFEIIIKSYHQSKHIIPSENDTLGCH